MRLAFLLPMTRFSRATTVLTVLVVCAGAIYWLPQVQLPERQPIWFSIENFSGAPVYRANYGDLPGPPLKALACLDWQYGSRPLWNCQGAELYSCPQGYLSETYRDIFGHLVCVSIALDRSLSKEPTFYIDWAIFKHGVAHLGNTIAASLGLFAKLLSLAGAIVGAAFAARAVFNWVRGGQP